MITFREIAASSANRKLYQCPLVILIVSVWEISTDCPLPDIGLLFTFLDICLQWYIHISGRRIRGDHQVHSSFCRLHE